MHCITSFHKDHWNLYARKFLSSWKIHWPSNATLTIYGQECESLCAEYLEDDDRITYIDVDSVENFSVFNKDAKIRIDDMEDKKRKGKFEKCLRWAHKVYAICDHIDQYNIPFVWLDADVVTLRKIPPGPKFFRRMIKKYDIAVAAEIQKGFEHWETGFFVVSGTVEQRSLIRTNMLSIYDSGDLYTRKNYWDGHIWPEACSHMSLHDLNIDMKGDAPGAFKNTFVRKYMIHAAGPRKFNKDETLNPRSGRLRLSD